MKKSLLIIAVLGLTFASCKKDRVCSCKTVSAHKLKTSPAPPVGLTAPADHVDDDKYTLVDASLRTANRACIHTKYEYESTYWTTTVDQNCSLE
ncbi:MAG: hypothetical protein V4635_17430 [Bacteroidota bacterium]